VAEVPDTLVLERHRDFAGVRRHGIWVRRALLTLVALVTPLALANVFGQRPVAQTVRAPAATLKLEAPDRVRGGLLFQARFHITAHRELKKATLVLDSGWAESITINTIEPSPVGEASRDGRLVFDLGHVPAGERHVLYMDFQVNPTTVSRRTLEVTLDDGDREILSLSRPLTIYP
jgi:hypothetical protein